MPSIVPDAGRAFRCKDAVEAVNHLRHLGKKKALGALRGYLASTQDDDKVLVICRLLFVNPKGRRSLSFGQAVPPSDQKVATTWPLFPVALSEHVPFLLVEGYRGAGRGESGLGCLELCAQLAMVEKDYPTSGYDQPARRLIHMTSFRQLYRRSDLPAMERMILQQAETNPPTRRE